MLPNYFKFQLYNTTGGTIEFSTDAANNTFTITAIPWKYTNKGAIEYGSSTTIFSNPSADLADNSTTESAEFDNTTDGWLGLFCKADFSTDVALTGTASIYWEWSSSDTAGGSYPSDDTVYFPASNAIFLSQLPTSATTGSRGVNFQVGAAPA